MAGDGEARELFHVGLFLGGALKAGLKHLGEEFKRRFRRAGHAVVDHVVGVALVAHKFGALGAQLGDLDGDGAIVELALRGAQAVAVKQLAAQVAVERVGHEAFEDRTVEADFPGLVAIRVERVLEICRETAEARLVGDDELEGLGFGEEVLAILRRQAGEFFVDLRHFGLDVRREGRAGAHEVAVGQLKQAGFLLVEAEAVLLFVYGFYPGEQHGVESDCVALARQHRIDLGLEGLNCFVRVGAGEVTENAHHLVERLAGALEGEDRVLETRLFGIADDRLDIGAGFQHALEDGGLEVFGLDFGEGRDAVSAGPFGAEGVTLELGIGDSDFRQLDLDRGGRGLVGGSSAAGGCGDESESGSAALQGFRHFHQSSSAWGV